ncbi:uncharacterized protein FOMMEDRAFT_131084 [Fomitiporia mediterranea MF3/22]|uniref:uncharacterized protein n=1 Tax=Fomitiporia mediterranea (strain MF3/22) TaxID=694068 RepID=UPI00044074A7|nr:uncharacterized protein FOMMEDRAFT_131084 [Fomitiporia mediterranea MF3/22]EJD08169.1 hypothetical protein FOMMEDRAFT_131084 [Fomitiporia mediterranea MF3/22]
MPGAIRGEKSRIPGPYQRKVVHFDRHATDISVTSTPVKKRAPVLIPGAETHKLQKRRTVSASRRRSSGLNVPSDGDVEGLPDFCYPKNPVRKTKPHARLPLAAAMSIDKFPVTSQLQDAPSSPFGKTMGKPDISDFSEMPHIESLERAIASSIAGSGDTLADARSAMAVEWDTQCRCSALKAENDALRRDYSSLQQRYDILLSMMKELRSKNKNETSQSQATIGEYMNCDGEEEFDRSCESNSPTSKTDGSFSTPSTSSTQLCTPAETPAMPVRVIDEDYDEGYDHRAVRAQLVRRDVSIALGLKPGMSLDETVDRLTESLATQWNIVEDEAKLSSTSDKPIYVFPPFPLPTIPVFEF